MSKMSSDEVNVDLFDEVTRLRKENEELKKKEKEIEEKLKVMLEGVTTDLREIESGGTGHIYLSEMQNKRLGLNVKNSVLLEVLDIVKGVKREEKTPVGKGLTKEDLANMSLDEIHELMDKAIKEGHLQFLREL